MTKKDEVIFVDLIVANSSDSKYQIRYEKKEILIPH